MAIFKKLWDEIAYLIKTISEGKKGENEEDFMKIRYESDDNLPLNKILKFPMLTVIDRSVFEENVKYYPQVFLDECVYEV